MANRIYSAVTTSISELKKNPSKMTQYQEVCVLNRCEPAFYCISPERMAELIQIEEDMKDLILCNERAGQKTIRVNLEDL